MSAATAPLDDCISLLRGETDAEKLLGLLLASNVCCAGDAEAAVKVYRAVGPQFLRHLFNAAGLTNAPVMREGYRRLAVTVLAGLARVPEVAADEGVVSMVPLIVEVMCTSIDPHIIQHCFDLMSNIALASDAGAFEFCTTEVMDMLLVASSSPDGSNCLEIVIKLLKLLVHKLHVDTLSTKMLQDITGMIVLLSRLFDVNRSSASDAANTPLYPQELPVDVQGDTHRTEIYDKSLEPGFRFRPTDKELILFYLKRKILGENSFQAIAEVQIYEFCPWDLPEKTLLPNDDEWYFFCPSGQKCRKGYRSKRTTPTGYWKSTCKDRKICPNSHMIGTKKSLVFHIGKVPDGEKTNWVMHEYRLEENVVGSKPSNGFLKDDYVLCKLFKKKASGRSKGEQYGAPLSEGETEDTHVDAPLYAPTPSSEAIHEDPAIQGDVLDGAGLLAVPSQGNGKIDFNKFDEFSMDELFAMTGQKFGNNLVGALPCLQDDDSLLRDI